MAIDTCARTLFDRIFDVLQPQFAKKVNGKQYDRLVIFAGNGLTRIAAALGESGNVSWHEWINKCLEDVNADQGLEYLLSLGYSLDQVFSYALHLAGEMTPALGPVTLWRHLWRTTLKLKPSPLHEALVEAADVIMTTNYDRLFEMTAKEIGIVPDTFDKFREQSNVEQSKNSPLSNKLPIYKLHGSFPLTESEFLSWCTEGPPAAASTINYERLAIEKPAAKFEELFTDVISALAGFDLTDRSTGSLVLFLGTGLGAEELIITRVLLAARALMTKRQLATTWIALETSEPLDPLFKFTRRQIDTIKLPLGLVASSEARALSVLALLKLALTATEYTGHDKKRLTKNIDNYKYRLPESPSSAGVRLADSEPRIVCVGQSGVNRVAGFEQSISEEKAYGAKKATWSPGAPGNERLLTTTEVGGQALIPCLVWDSLGIPCAFMSHVWDDDLGRVVLRALQATKWIDFSGVNQVSNRPGKVALAPMSTENMTAATWFGIRTILDLYPQSELHCDEKPRLFGAPMVYVTKRGWKKVRNSLNGQPEHDPLIVFETGGRGGEIHAESWVAERKGVILASAESALGWFAIDRGNPIDTKASSEERINLSRAKWKDWSDKFGASVKDDRGRVFQNAELIATLRDRPQPAFLFDSKGLLNDLLLYGITLGDLGIVFWRKAETGQWIGPRWCFSAELSNAAEGGLRAIDDHELRNGLGCGDVSRAGFCASLLLNNLADGPVRPLSPATADAAVAWAHWFGTSKVRFFSLTEYLSWLKNRERATELIEAIKNSLRSEFSDRQAFTFATDTFTLTMRIEPAVTGSDLHPDLTRALNQLEIWKNSPQKWSERIAKWREARGIKLN